MICSWTASAAVTLTDGPTRICPDDKGSAMMMGHESENRRRRQTVGRLAATSAASLAPSLRRTDHRTGMRMLDESCCLPGDQEQEQKKAAETALPSVSRSSNSSSSSCRSEGKEAGKREEQQELQSREAVVPSVE